ncbi:MAG: hypothetical protein ACI4EI_04580 [Muricoprocola sp.]
MKKNGKKIIAVTLCAGMTASLLTGCAASLKSSDIVAVNEGVNITLGEACVMLRYNQAETQNYLGGLFGDGNLFQQDLTGSGEAYGDIVKESVMHDLQDMTNLEAHMADYDVEITADEQAAIEAAAKQFIADNDEKTLKAMYADETSVARALTLYTIQSKMEDAIKAGADTEVSDEDAAQKTIEYVFLDFPEEETEEETTEAASEETEEEATEAVSEETEEETTEAVSEETEEETTEAASEETEEETTEAASEEIEEETEAPAEEELTEAQQEVVAKAQEIMDAVDSGSTLEEAVTAADETLSVSTESYGKDNNDLDEDLFAAVDGLTDGEMVSEPVVTANGVYVAVMSSTFDEEATAQRKEEIIKERQDDLYSSTIEEWEAGNFEIKSDVWDKVDFFDLYTVKAVETEETETEAAAEETEITTETETSEETEVTETEVSEETEVTETEASEETETAATEA